MIRVLRRLRQLRHIDVVGSLCVARIDVGAWDAVGLLARHEFISSLLFFSYSTSFFTAGKGEEQRDAAEIECVRAVGT